MRKKIEEIFRQSPEPVKMEIILDQLLLLFSEEVLEIIGDNDGHWEYKDSKSDVVTNDMLIGMNVLREWQRARLKERIGE